MDWRHLLELSAHTIAILLLLLIAMSAMRLAMGEPLVLAEFGVALLVALLYPRLAGLVGHAPQWRKK